MRSRLSFILLAIILIISCAQDYPPKSEGEIVKHTYYSLSYSEEHEQALWVYYVLTDEMINGPAKRGNNFRPDPSVSTGSATIADYKGSGYDRGHLCPAASMTIDATAMSESFYFSNMSPQAPAFNQRGWQRLESIVRNFADEEKKIYVVTGPVLNDPIGKIGTNGVTIPSMYYKVIYAPKNEKMIAFLMPNAKLEEPVESYAVCVDKVEDITGIDFYHSLPDEVENKLESTHNVSQWEFEQFTRSVTTNTSNSTSVQCKGIAKSTGVRCKTKTTNPNGYCRAHQSQAK